MSTNSTITLKNRDGKFETIYSHWDGYISGVGATLKKSYNTPEKVQALVNLGGLSVLDDSIECPEGHTFDNCIEGHTVFYGRDRGETGMEKEISDSFKSCQKEEFNYIFKDGEWFVSDHGKKLVKF